MNYQGKNILVLGLGSSGLAAARLLKKMGAIVTVLDSGKNDLLEERAERLRTEGINVFLRAVVPDQETNYDLAILSPGIEKSAPLVCSVTDRGIPLLGEIELAYSLCPLPIVAITGSNGKTTTTELTVRVLEGGGLRALACGNIGLSFSEAILSAHDYDFFVVEISSFQLETTEKFHPKVAVWLNLSPNHLDRYPSMEAYRAAKLRIFQNQQAEDTAIIPKNFDYSNISLEAVQDSLLEMQDKEQGAQARSVYGNTRGGEHLSDAVVRHRSRTFNRLLASPLTFSAYEQGADFSFEKNHLCYHGKPFLNFQETRLRGLHNVENLMAAFAVGVALKLELTAMAKAIKNYTPPPHRCELVTTHEGITWINDSKATTLEAMEKAINSIEKTSSLILIAGGKNKGFSFAPILPLVKERVKKAILIGERRDLIMQEWPGVDLIKAQSLEEAVILAATFASAGDTILLSPGTSSYDMFRDYQERGERFKEAIHQLIRQGLLIDRPKAENLSHIAT